MGFQDLVTALLIALSIETMLLINYFEYLLNSLPLEILLFQGSFAKMASVNVSLLSTVAHLLNLHLN